jgi:[ribosomal protein S18]-alanine N-acetyltransferase
MSNSPPTTSLRCECYGRGCYLSNPFGSVFFHNVEVFLPQGESLIPSYNDEVQFSLRDFRPEDFRMLWEIDQRCFAPGIAYSQRELSSYIRRRGAFTIVAEQARGPDEKDMIAGFIVAEAGGKAGHVISIDVLPESRRSGLGSKLLLTAEERLRTLDCRTVVLETAVDNTTALAFYKRQGYSVIKVYPRYYSNGVDAFVLGKSLDQPATLTPTG